MQLLNFEELEAIVGGIELAEIIIPAGPFEGTSVQDIILRHKPN